MKTLTLLNVTVRKDDDQLMFPVADLPQMSKGKGNKIISIPSADAAAGVDKLQWLLILPPGSSITIYVGKRKLIMRDEDLQKVRAERGRRGSVSRGLQRIDSVEVNAPARPKSDANSEE